ncbi:MAG: tripartite tricarboxylate transporter TctB family protein [Alphaproteobacteria bacterium]|nr:tripartite tricarboxylate transporter TctB family protein [Alphaproteobacteria bacterium]
MLSVAVTGRLVAATLVLTGIFGAIGGYRLGLWIGPTPGPGLMPFAASLMLAAFAAVPALGRARAFAEDGAATVWPRLVSYAGAAGLLCVAPPLVGTTASFIAALMLVLAIGERMPAPRSLALSLAIALATIALFRLALDVPLPDPVIDRLLGR